MPPPTQTSPRPSATPMLRTIVAKKPEWKAPRVVLLAPEKFGKSTLEPDQRKWIIQMERAAGVI